MGNDLKFITIGIVEVGEEIHSRIGVEPDVQGLLDGNGEDKELIAILDKYKVSEMNKEIFELIVKRYEEMKKQESEEQK